MTAPSADPATADDGLVDALAEAAFATMGLLTRVSAEHGISLTLLRVLAILRDRRLGVTALADHLGLEKSTMSGLIDRAQRRGLVVREPRREDARAVDVVLTAAGRELAERGADEVRRMVATMTTGLSVAERRRLQALLERVVRPL